MHVPFLPKWYPGRKDPQLGDFLRKQAMATAAFVRMSVVHVESYAAGEHVAREQLSETDGLWELVLRYPANTSQWTAYRKAVNAVRYWMAATRGWHRVVQERGRPDLIHAYILVRPVLFARWIRFRHRTPYLISEQSSEYLDGTFAAKSALFKFINRRSFRKASAITAVSNWLGDQLVRLDLCARYDVVPNVVPGLDRPLKTAAHLLRFVGQQVSVTLKQPFQGRKAFKGVLGGDESGWTLVLDDGKGEQVLGFALAEVREARLVPVLDFKGRKGRKVEGPADAAAPAAQDGGQDR